MVLEELPVVNDLSVLPSPHVKFSSQMRETSWTLRFLMIYLLGTTDFYLGWKLGGIGNWN